MSADKRKRFEGIPKLGIGLAALGRPGYINLGHSDDLRKDYDVAAMQENTNRVLDVALAGGVKYYDAARSYGRAEEFLSNWLKSRSIDPSSIVAGSKWGYRYTADWQINAEAHEIKARLRGGQQFGLSWGLLGDRGLALYQIHSATFESGVLTNQAVLDELAAIRERTGTLIGLSLSGPAQADVLRAALRCRSTSGARVFDSVQATFNLLERSVGPALQEAHDAGLLVIVKEGMANGRLTPRNADPAFASRLRALMGAAEELGTSFDSVALGYIAAQPFVDIVLSGAATPEHMASNLGALQVDLGRLSEGARAALEAMVQPAAEYWGERSAMAWN
eukprot:tig00001368_g8412.t1